MANYAYIGTYARSGSTFLCQLLKNFQEFQVFHEIFHFHLSAITSYLPDIFPDLKIRLGLPEDEALAREALCSDPLRYLDAIQAFYPRNILAFKVFPGHLASGPLLNLADHSRLLILLHRNLVHTYISTKIANAIQQWPQVDTSCQHVAFVPAEFRTFADRTLDVQRYLKHHAEANGLPLVEFTYEALTAADDPCALVADALVRDQGLSLTRCDKPLDIARQDKRSLASEKVSNPEEMRAFLRECGLESLDDATQPNPPLESPFFNP